MAIAVRSKGRAAARYSDEQLLPLVRKIALWANRARPTTVKQTQFDEARAGAGHPDAPSARAICMRLGAAGRSRPWSNVLEAALRPQKGREPTESRHLAEAAAPHLGPRHLYFALNLVAKHLDLRSLTPQDYDDGREWLVASESRRRTGVLPHQPDLLAQLLPNSAQIERIARELAPVGDVQEDAERTTATDEEIVEDVATGGQGRASGDADWDVALEAAGLEPRHERIEERRRTARRHFGLPLAEAIHHFVETNGYWPARLALEEFAVLLDIGVQTNAGRSWSEWIEQARAYRTSVGIETPDDLPGPKGGGLEIKIPDGGIPGAPRRRRDGGGVVTEEDCLAALMRFDRELSAGEKRTRKAYKAFATKHGLPSTSTIDKRFGGFKRVLEKARARRRSESS